MILLHSLLLYPSCSMKTHMFVLIVFGDISIGLGDFGKLPMCSGILGVDIRMVHLGQFVVLPLDVGKGSGGFETEDGEIGG